MKSVQKNPADMATQLLGLAEAAEHLCSDLIADKPGFEGLEAVLVLLREKIEEFVDIVPNPENEGNLTVLRPLSSHQ